MPWCDTCDEYRAPTALTPEGHCPVCQDDVDTADVAEQRRAPDKAPWHFKLMVFALVVYLGWRLIEGIAWIVGQF
jgi:hypothetical protein